MFTDDWEKFSEAYQNANQETRNFIDSDIVPKFIRTELTELGIPSTIIRDIILFCNNKVLRIADESELQSYLLEKQLEVNTFLNIINACLQLFITAEDISRLSHQEINNATRTNVLTATSGVKKYLYESQTSRLRLMDFAVTYNVLSGDLYKKMVILVGDIVLGFYKIEDTVPLLQQELGIDARRAALLGADVLDFLAPLSDPNFVIPVEKEDLEETPVYEMPATMAVQQSEQSIASNPAPTPSITTDALQKFTAARAQLLAETSAPELRTMAQDMAQTPTQPTVEQSIATDEPIYSSKQPEVRSPLSGLPAYTNMHQPVQPAPTVHEPARWS